MASDHIEKAWEEFQRVIGLLGPAESERRERQQKSEAAGLRRAFFAGAYASYVLAVTLGGRVSVEEGAQVMNELAEEFDHELAVNRKRSAPR